MEKSTINRLGLIFLGLTTVFCSFAGYEKLDSAISMRGKNWETKENKLEELKNIYLSSLSDQANLELLEMIFEEYKHFNYDSATYYADEIYQIAEEVNNEYYKTNSLLHIALMNVNNGNLDIADQILDDIERDELAAYNLKEYNRIKYLLNLNKRRTSTAEGAKEHYSREMGEALSSMIENTDRNTPDYYYGIAEKLNLIDNRPDSALIYYQKVLERVPKTSELYADATISIARLYKNKGDKKLYKEWLTRAALADIEIPLNENRALEELSMLIYEEEPDNVNKATDYHQLMVDNVLFYDNGTRIREVSENFPSVLPAFMANIRAKEKDFHFSLIILVIFIAVLAVLVIFIKKQKEIIGVQKDSLETKEKELSNRSSLLEQRNMELAVVNKKLSVSRQRYQDIHLKRENIAKVWIDMCTAQINKIKSFRLMLKQKAKSNKTPDLLNYDDFRPINGEELQRFLSRFDKTFLDLYPNFTDEINKLLREDSQIILKSPYSLTTELRICALIKLGVKDSSEMSDLLFASVQTIYNNRTRLRNRAIDKENLEDQIEQIN